MGVDKWDVIISHMGNCLKSVLSIQLKAWDISAERKHLWQRWAVYFESILIPGNCRLWGRYGWQVRRSRDSDFQEDPIIKSKLKRLTFTSPIAGASNNQQQGSTRASQNLLVHVSVLKWVWGPVRRKEWKWNNTLIPQLLLSLYSYF